MSGNLARLSPQELRDLLSRRLDLKDFQVLWASVFEEDFDNVHPGLGLDLGCIKLVDRARRTGRWERLLESIRTRSLDLDEAVAPTPPPAPPLVPPEPPKRVRRVLILASNPVDVNPLDLEREMAKIKEHLKESRTCEFLVVAERFVQPQDLTGHLLRHAPEILHYCGHGVAGGHLVLENQARQAQVTSAEAIVDLVGILPVDQRPKCVVLNACVSWDLAQKLENLVDCVVGMTQSVSDQAAIEFSCGFYQALAHDQTFETAFRLGRNRLRLLNLPDSELPRWMVRA